MKLSQATNINNKDGCGFTFNIEMIPKMSGNKVA